MSTRKPTQRCFTAALSITAQTEATKMTFSRQMDLKNFGASKQWDTIQC